MHSSNDSIHFTPTVKGHFEAFCALHFHSEWLLWSIFCCIEAFKKCFKATILCTLLPQCVVTLKHCFLNASKQPFCTLNSCSEWLLWNINFWMLQSNHSTHFTSTVNEGFEAFLVALKPFLNASKWSLFPLHSHGKQLLWSIPCTSLMWWVITLKHFWLLWSFSKCLKATIPCTFFVSVVAICICMAHSHKSFQPWHNWTKQLPCTFLPQRQRRMLVSCMNIHIVEKWNVWHHFLWQSMLQMLIEFVHFDTKSAFSWLDQTRKSHNAMLWIFTLIEFEQTVNSLRRQAKQRGAVWFLTRKQENWPSVCVFLL